MPRIAVEARIKNEMLGRMKAEMRAAVSEFVQDAADAILAESQKRVPVGATTGLKDSGHVLPPTPTDWAEIAYSAPYAMYVHEGTRPHFPPPDALIRWVELVLGKHGKEAERIAWAIARAISKRGTKPNPFLREAVEAVLPDLEPMFRRKIQERMDRLSQQAGVRA